MVRQFTCSNVEQFECVIATDCKTLHESQSVNEPSAFEVSCNLYYFLCVTIGLDERVLTRRYEGWLRTGLDF